MQTMEEGRVEQAVGLLRRAVQSQPRDAEAHACLALALLRVGNPEQAIFYAEKSVTLDPRCLSGIGLIGVCHLSLGDAPKAEAALRRHLEFEPESGPTWGNLGVACLMQQRFGEAEVALRTSLRLAPGLVPITASLAQLLVQTGRGDEGLRLLDTLPPSAAQDPLTTSTAAFASNYVTSITPARVRQLHEHHAQVLSRGIIATNHTPRAQPPRPLKVGVLSPDLCDHAVARFVRAIARHHDRSQIELHAYYVGAKQDALCDELKASFFKWTHALGGLDAHLADTIRRDGMHVLIDLAGNTAAHRLGVLAAKPAPLQITAIGYPSTTGLGTIDFRAVDSITDPPGAESHCTERLLRIDPCFLCYTPDTDMPPPSVAPVTTGQPLTFGSFNNIAKVSDECLKLWAAVLTAVPGSRLAIKSMNLKDDAMHALLRSRARAAGIDDPRLLIIDPPQARLGHLSAYSRVDIALDTFPYAGTTTTCEALMMGVPVITLGGPDARSHAGRVGISLLGAAGFPDGIAQSRDDYVSKAVELGADITRLSHLRTTLRERVLASVLCDGPAYAARWIEALMSAWRTMAT